MFIRHPLTLLTECVPALDVNPENVCLLVQDLHAPFSDPKGGWLAARAASKILTSEFEEYFDTLATTLPNTARILSVVRDVSLPVVYSCLGYRPPDSPSEFQKAMGWAWNLEGSDGAFPVGVHPAEDESLFTKPAWGALANPELDRFLRERAIEHVMLVGVPLDFGLAQTCGQLADRGIRSLVISDAVASITRAGQSYTRDNLAHGLTKLRTTGEVLDLLDVLATKGNVLI